VQPDTTEFNELEHFTPDSEVSFVFVCVLFVPVAIFCVFSAILTGSVALNSLLRSCSLTDRLACVANCWQLIYAEIFRVFGKHGQ